MKAPPGSGAQLPAWGPALAVAAYWGSVGILGGFRGDHVFVGCLVLGLAYSGARGRQVLLFLLPLILTAVVYDAQRYAHAVFPRAIITSGLYELERAAFGINTEAGRITPNEWLLARLHPVLDLVSGLTYLLFMPAFVLTAAYFERVAGRRGTRTRSPDHARARARRVMWSLFWVNVAGFLTHTVFPTAPPWYVAEYGFGPVALEAPPDPAGTARFDAVIGIDYFAGLYQKSVNVFGAMPSLHIGWSAIALYWAIRFGALRVLSASFLASMCFAAVYLNHHYVVDVVAGAIYGFVGAWIFDLVSEGRGPEDDPENQAGDRIARGASP